MRVDQLDEASRTRIGADNDLRLFSHHRDFAAEIARAFRSRQAAAVPEDLGRHLGAAHGLSPDQYCRRWGLPAAYPMVPPPSHEERMAWRRRLAPRSDGVEPDPSPLRLQEESRRIGAGRSRREHRRGAPAGLRHDWGKPGTMPDRRSEGPRPDGFRR
jgi:hypothetical protein